MERMVRAFSVTSSPTSPSPRVSACASLPLAIVHGHGKPVQLQLGDVGELFLAQKPAHAPVEVPQFRLAQRVVQAQHGAGMPHLDETLARLAAHALGGRIRRDQLRMRGFQLLELAHHRVVFRVGDFGRVQHVVQVFVMAQLLAKSFDFSDDWSHARYDEWIERYRQPVLIYNPYAGKIRRKPGTLQRTTAALARANVTPRVLATDAAGHATELAREAVEQGADLVLVLGGDGTVNEVANGLAYSGVPLGVLPAGTANVLAMELGLGSHLDRANERSWRSARHGAWRWAG